ncbi:MAG: hypothetical protein ACRD21_27030, partial [Vicinamibacteria bacterium]
MDEKVDTMIPVTKLTELDPSFSAGPPGRRVRSNPTPPLLFLHHSGLDHQLDVLEIEDAVEG